MIKNESENGIVQDGPFAKNVCDLKYLTEMMGWKKHLIKGVMDTFLKQIPEELGSIEDAIKRMDYPVIKSFSHTMKSSVSIMGISTLTPVLQEMQNLGDSGANIERIKELNEQLKLICKRALEEIEIQKQNYV